MNPLRGKTRSMLRPDDPSLTGVINMADALAKKKIKDALKSGYFNDPDDMVDVSDGADDNIHLVIVSRKFDGRYMEEKESLIWSNLMTKLTPAEWGQVTLSVGASPDEIKSI